MMDGVNKPGAGQQVPPADESENKETSPPKNEHKPQTGFGERPKGRSLKDRMKRVTTTDGGPSIRPDNPSSSPSSNPSSNNEEER